MSDSTAEELLHETRKHLSENHYYDSANLRMHRTKPADPGNSQRPGTRSGPLKGSPTLRVRGIAFLSLLRATSGMNTYSPSGNFGPHALARLVFAVNWARREALLCGRGDRKLSNWTYYGLTPLLAPCHPPPIKRTLWRLTFRWDVTCKPQGVCEKYSVRLLDWDRTFRVRQAKPQQYWSEAKQAVKMTTLNCWLFWSTKAQLWLSAKGRASVEAQARQCKQF